MGNELDQMLDIAQAATDGPWGNCQYDGCHCGLVWGPDGKPVCGAPTPYHDLDRTPEEVDANARFIATFDPPTAINLLQMKQGMSKRVDELASLCDDTTKQRDAYRNGCREAEAEVERLQKQCDDHRETIRWLRSCLGVLEGKVTGVAGLLDELVADRAPWLLDEEDDE